MAEQLFTVLVDNAVVAKNMPLDIVAILVKALFHEYHEQASVFGMTVDIKSEVFENGGETNG